MLQIIVVTIIEAKNGGSWVIEREEKRERGGIEKGNEGKRWIWCVDLILLFGVVRRLGVPCRLL